MPRCCSQLITQYAIGREHELTVFELPLYREEIRNGYPHKHWALWDDQIATILHRNREVVRNLRQEFSGVPHYTTQEIFRTCNPDVAVPDDRRGMLGVFLAVNLEFAGRLAHQCERLGVPHAISPMLPSGMLQAAVRAAVREFSELTGVAIGSADFLGQVEHYGSVDRGSLSYWR